ncbi:PAS domain S-box protein [Desulfocurvus sp. DL9XJH121]
MNKDSPGQYETALTDWADSENLVAAQRELDALRHEMDRLVRVIADSPMIIYRADPARGCAPTFISENVTDVLGYRPSEVLADPNFWASRTHPDDLAKGGYRACTSVDECVTQEYRVRRKDGTWAWIQDRNCLAGGPPGSAPELIGSMADVTAARSERENLLKHGRMFKTIFRDAPSGIAICAPDGTFMEANGKWMELFGVTWDDLRDVTPLDFTHRDGLAHCTEMQQRILAGHKESLRAEQRFRRRNGTLFWGSMVARGLPGTDGGVQGMICILHDITERKKAQRDLAESEEKFRAIVESSPMGIHLLRQDENGELILVEANEAAAGLLGMEHGQGLGESLKNVLPGLAGTDVIERCQSVIATGTPWHSGPQPYSDKRISGIFDIHVFRAEARTCCVQLQDVTERIRSEEALRRSEREKKAILDTISDAVTFQDANHTILWANRTVRDAAGLTSEEIVGRVCHALWGSDTGPCLACPLTPCLREKQPMEAITVAPNGRVFRTKAYPFRMGDNERDGALVVSTDITEEKRAEDELRKARDLAENAVKMKDEFLANMSHELRSPLNGMLGMLDVVLDSGLDAEQRDSIEIALSAGEGLLAIINDILDFSKLSADKISLTRNPFELRRTLHTVINTFREQSRSKDLEVTYEVAPDVPETLVGDEGRVRQILFNLVGNAVKFTQKGSVRTRVDILRKSAHPEEARLLFTVEDTGIGIPQDQMETIFDPFVQLNWAKSHKYEGTGLGLGIVKRLVTLMGGIVTMESEVDRGTTVSFWINVQIP